MTEDNYDDIINLPHHTSKLHPRMSMQNRAAQFAPFSALTGHNAAIIETARLTDGRIELSEERKKTLDRKLAYIRNRMEHNPSVSIKHFIPDIRKSGGSFKTVTGTVKKIDDYENSITLFDGTHIYMSSILSIETDFPEDVDLE